MAFYKKDSGKKSITYQEALDQALCYGWIDGEAAPYSFETRPQALAPAYETQLKANARAWAFYQAQPPWYRRTSTFWVMSAKQEETRQRRLEELIKRCASASVIGPLKR